MCADVNITLNAGPAQGHWNTGVHTFAAKTEKGLLEMFVPMEKVRVAGQDLMVKEADAKFIRDLQADLGGKLQESAEPVGGDVGKWAQHVADWLIPKTNTKY